jgi:hypothetical protein
MSTSSQATRFEALRHNRTQCFDKSKIFFFVLNFYEERKTKATKFILETVKRTRFLSQNRTTTEIVYNKQTKNPYEANESFKEEIIKEKQQKIQKTQLTAFA